MKDEDEDNKMMDIKNLMSIFFQLKEHIEELQGDIYRLKKIINKSLKLIKLNL
jgi:hypothetical protein